MAYVTTWRKDAWRVREWACYHRDISRLQTWVLWVHASEKPEPPSQRGTKEREKSSGTKMAWVWNGATHVRNRHSYLMLAVQFLKKRAKGKTMSHGGKNIYIINQVQCSCCFNSVIIMIIPSSSDTSSISSTVSGKLMRCFSVVVFWAQEKRKQLPTTAKGKVQLFIQYVPMWLSQPLF